MHTTLDVSLDRKTQPNALKACSYRKTIDTNIMIQELNPSAPKHYQ